VDFGFTPEQEALRATVRAAARRSTRDDPLWTVLTGQIGLTALAIPEAHGGDGASLVEVAIAIEELGAALAPVPYLSSACAAAAIDPDCPAAAALLPDLAAGRTVATLALAEPGTGWLANGWRCTATRDGDRYLLDGVKEHVLDGDVADLAIVGASCDGGEPALFAVALTDRTVHPTLDQTRRQARLVFRGAPAVHVNAANGAVDLLLAALAVESVGVARTSLARIVEHLRTREQFGVALATFQALRHRVADLAVAVESATSSAWYAIRVAGTEEFAVAAPLAKLVAAEAAYTVTAASIQLHGGIGFTWEHDAHRYFKRATTNRLLGGDPVALRRLIGSRIGFSAARL